MKKIIVACVALVCAVFLIALFMGGDDSESTSPDDSSLLAEENLEEGIARDMESASQGGDDLMPKAGSKIITRADGSVIKMGGYKAVSPSNSAPVYASTLRAENLPSKVDLRKYMTRIEDQGQIGSCTANATAGAYEYLLSRNQGVSDYDVSRLFLYYNTRAIRHWENQDSGGVIQDVLVTLNRDGICSEKTWPYIESQFKQKPSQQSYEEALKNRISKYERIPLDLASWKSVLAEGYPIIFGVSVYSSFMNPRNGRIPLPGSNEENMGGHAMCCVGYSDPDRVFIVRNSWGHQWGDGGYCYIPYDYMMNPGLNDGDSWVIYDVNPIDQQNAEETWVDDSESLFVDMENEFADMPDDQWYAMCDELGDCDIVFRLGALYNIACWGDEDMAPEEAKLAVSKLKNILLMFGLDYSPKKVFNHCEKIWVNEDDDFFEKTVAILSRYLSEGARATIAADMLEICNADEDAADDERDLILGLVVDWLNDDLIEAYYSDYLDEEDYDDFEYYDDEDEYYYDEDFDYGDYDEDYDDDYDYDYDYDDYYGEDADYDDYDYDEDYEYEYD